MSDAPNARPLALPRLAWRLLKRDLASGRLVVMLMATIIAVASTVSVNLLVARVDRALLAESSALLAGDLAIASNAPPPRRYIDDAQAGGLASAELASLRSVVSAGGRLQLTQVKAVDSAYPLRGRLEIAASLTAPAVVSAHGPAPGEAWADARLFNLLGLAPGATLGIGRAQLRLSQVLVLEPDGGDDLFSIAPRVMIHRDDLSASGLVVPGSRVAYTTLIAGPGDAVARYRAALVLEPGHSVLDPRNARPQLRAAITQAGRFLTLAAFSGVMLAGIGIALAAAGYAEIHETTVAILKTLGLGRGAVLRLLALELVLLAAAATLVGDALALVVHELLLSRLLPLAYYAQIPAPWPALAQGGLVAVVALAGFALPALGSLARLPVTTILARDRSGLPTMRAGHVLAMTAAMIAIAPWPGGNARLVAYALGGLLAAAALLAGGGYALVRLLARGRNRTRMSWRFGLASVARRARLTVLQTTALGLGLAVVLLLGLVRDDLFGQWRARLPANAPNQFLINVQPDEREPLDAFLHVEAGVSTTFYPMIRGRLVGRNGAPLSPDHYPEERARRLVEREFNLSYADAPKSDNRIVAGRWWTSPDAAELSVEAGLAQTLGLALGDELEFLVADRRVRARVTSLRHVDWDNFQVNFFIVAPPSLLADVPATFITSFRLEPSRTRLMSALVQQFPSVTVIDVEAMMQQVRGVMERVAQALTWVFAFALAAGALVLAAAVQASQRERLRDTVLLKTLGASRQFMRSALLAEFVTLGLVAGTLGTTAALGTGWLVARRVLDMPYEPDWRIALAGVAVAVLSLVAVGLRVAARTVREPALPGLREVQ